MNTSTQPNPDVFVDGDGDHWIRTAIPGCVTWVSPMAPRTKRALYRLQGDQVEGSRNSGRTWNAYGVFVDANNAIAHLWPDQPKSEPTPAPVPTQKPIEWQFKSTAAERDIDRVLREAYDAGAREVTVESNGLITTYLHRSVGDLCRRAGVFKGTGVTHGDRWFAYTGPGNEVLARARKWEAQRAVTKVRGVR
jgi:hypothetical protein